MTTYETLGIIMASFGVIISIISLVFSMMNNIKVKNISYGQSEFLIRETITNAKNRIADILNSPNLNKNKHYKQCLKVAKEQLLDIYEESCAKYIDSKIDKIRFKRTYSNEIKNIVESDFKEYFSFGSKYQAIKKVYDEWFNLEK